MSGGSWDYLYHRIQECADRLAESQDPRRLAMAPHVARLAEAMHDIEWVDSCDYGPGQEVASIDAFLAGFGSPDVQRQAAVLRVIRNGLATLEGPNDP